MENILVIYIGAELIWSIEASMNNMQTINDLVNIKKFADSLPNYKCDYSKSIFNYFDKNNKWTLMNNKTILLSTLKKLKEIKDLNTYKAVVMVLSGHGTFTDKDGYGLKINQIPKLNCKENHYWQKDIMEFFENINCMKILIGNSCNLNPTKFISNLQPTENKTILDIRNDGLINGIKELLSTQNINNYQNGGINLMYESPVQTNNFELKNINPSNASILSQIVSLNNIPIAIKDGNNSEMMPLLLLGFEEYLYPTTDNYSSVLSNCLEMLANFRYPISLEKLYFFINSVININNNALIATQDPQDKLSVGFVCYNNNFATDVNNILDYNIK